jgi:hypothetical protein
MTTVRGTLRIPPESPSVDAQCTLTVRDVTHSDASAAEPVAQTSLFVRVDPRGAAPEFSLDVPDAALNQVGQGKKALNLEVHVDLDGSGLFSPGDLVSMHAQPIGPDSANAALEVPLALV